MRSINLSLFGLGALLMCLPALFTSEMGLVMRWVSIAFLFVGYGTFISAIFKNGWSKPETAMSLLLASNISFWASCGLYILRLKVIEPSPEEGIDAFAGPVAFWLILLVPFLLYEMFIFLRAIPANKSRTVAVIGLAACFVQVFVTLRMIYGFIQGV